MEGIALWAKEIQGDLQVCGRKLAKARADFDVKECPINISEHIRTKNIDG